MLTRHLNGIKTVGFVRASQIITNCFNPLSAALCTQGELSIWNLVQIIITTH